MTVVCRCGYRFTTQVSRRIIAAGACVRCRAPLVNARIVPEFTNQKGYNQRNKTRPAGATNTHRPLTDPPGMSWKAADSEIISHLPTSSLFARTRCSRRARRASGDIVVPGSRSTIPTNEDGTGQYLTPARCLTAIRC